MNGTFISYKKRWLNDEKPVRVYRNLNKPGKWYSVQQKGLVIGHTQHLLLTNCRFIVNERLRQNVIRNHRKVVHAFIEGFIKDSAMGITMNGALPARIKYNPYTMNSFVCDNFTPTPFKVKQARAVVINPSGVFGAYLS